MTSASRPCPDTVDISSPTRSLRRVGIVVPVKNEQESLPACLTSLARAAAALHLPVRIVVVLDDCADNSGVVVDTAAREITELRCRSLSIEPITVRRNNVGAARAAGFATLLAGQAAADRDSLWLASTDADSTVPTDWLCRQLAHADAGADVVAGTITVADWAQRSATVAVLAEQHYATTNTATPNLLTQEHRHVHGANLGFTAAAYQIAGGFAELSVHEDVALLDAFAVSGLSVAWASDLPVTTSARREARAPRGFASYLDDLERAVSTPVAPRPLRCDGTASLEPAG